jgi:hypothetical protein
MARLEQLTLGASVRGLVTGATGRVVQVEWFGDDKAVKVTFEEPSGAVRNRPVYGSDEASLELAGWGRAWSFNCDGYVFRLASEASAHLTRYSSTARVSSAAPFRAACIAAPTGLAIRRRSGGPWRPPCVSIDFGRGQGARDASIPVRCIDVPEIRHNQIHNDID